MMAGTEAQEATAGLRLPETALGAMGETVESAARAGVTVETAEMGARLGEAALTLAPP